VGEGVGVAGKGERDIIIGWGIPRRSYAEFWKLPILIDEWFGLHKL